MSQLILIEQHCFYLCHLLQNLPNPYLSKVIETKDRDRVQLSDVTEWLYLAASVRRVEIDTSYFDGSVIMCRPAWEYQVARSELLSEVTTHLSRFNFVWGAFESLAKLIEPPNIPKNIKKDASGLVDRVVYFLKINYEPKMLPPCFLDVLSEFTNCLLTAKLFDVSADEFSVSSYMGSSGIGIKLVSKIRNKFAHGSGKFPEPEGWGSHSSCDSRLILAATRIVLLSMQIALIAYFRNVDFYVDCLKYEFMDENLFFEEESIHRILQCLHLSAISQVPGQLSLLDLEYE